MIPIPRRRLLYLMGLAFIPALLGIFFSEMFAVQLLLYALIFSASAWDFTTIPRPDRLRLERRMDTRLSIGVDNRVTVFAENLTHRRLFLEVRDEYPDEFIVERDTLAFDLGPLSVSGQFYTVKPPRKGSFIFSGMYVRVHGALGLISRQYRVPLVNEVRVYPDILELKKYLRMTTLNRIEQLGYRKREPGGENEFDFLREYRSGDDYKRIHWKATAKRRFPVTRIYDREYNRNVVCLLDGGRMMTTRYGLLTKLDYAVNATLVLAAAAKTRKDLFGLTVFADGIRSHVQPGRGSRLYTGVLPALCAARAEFIQSDYRKVYAHLMERVRKNSILFVFSELYNRIVSEDLTVMLEMLSRRHTVHFVSFEEKEEEDEDDSPEGIARWTLQREQTLEKELIIRELVRKGVRTLRVNHEDITRRVVNSYLGS